MTWRFYYSASWSLGRVVGRIGIGSRGRIKSAMTRITVPHIAAFAIQFASGYILETVVLAADTTEVAALDQLLKQLLMISLFETES